MDCGRQPEYPHMHMQTPHRKALSVNLGIHSTMVTTTPLWCFISLYVIPVDLSCKLLVIKVPVKLRFLPAVKSILKLFDQVGLAWHPEETLLIESLLPNEIHTLLD